MPDEAGAASAKAQRLRIRFARRPEAAQVGHIDLARLWERALRDAGVPVSSSQGNRPRPRLALAAGLPVGVTSDVELVDVVLAERRRPDDVVADVGAHLPEGVAALAAWEVGIGLPSLPSSVRWADYEVEVPAPEVAVAASVEAFLARERLPWEDTRGEKVRHYDLRALVQDLRVEGRGAGSPLLWMRLRCDSSGVGRPDQVVKALKLPDAMRTHRVGLVLAEESPARRAWRRRGRYVER